MADLLHPFPSFIKNSYGIRVAVRSTQDVEELCRKNHLSFCELLRPFSQLSTESKKEKMHVGKGTDCILSQFL